VHGIMRKLVSNKLASTYNFLGRNKEGFQKRKFKGSTLYTIVIGT